MRMSASVLRTAIADTNSMQRCRRLCGVRGALLAPLALLAAVLVLTVDVSQLNLLHRSHADTTTLSKEDAATAAFYRSSIQDALSLQPADLPGYTGWSRPASTLAPFFSIVGVSGPAQTFANWTVTIQCHRPEATYHDDDSNVGKDCCRDGGSLFYVRAYGPSILPGFVTDYRNGTYDVTILPFDAGMYHVEVVMTFSDPPSLETLPVHDREYGYEGYLLPGFPLQVPVVSSAHGDGRTVQTGRPESSTARACRMSDLVEPLPDGHSMNAFNRGRWLLLDKVNYNGSSHNDALRHRTVKDSVARKKGYQSGLNSIGFQMDYVPLACDLISEKEVMSKSTLEQTWKRKNLTLPSQFSVDARPIRILFIGDSNFGAQQELFDSYFGGMDKNKFWDTERLTTWGGIVKTLPGIRERLEELRLQVDTRFFLIFNTGLHDLDRLCNPHMEPDRKEYIGIPDDEFSCLKQYEQSVTEYIQLIHSFPAELKVWQTTTAGWPKWGVYGAEWPVRGIQTAPLETNYVSGINDAAFRILANESLHGKSHIAVLDAYWLSLSRPDNRQINDHNGLPAHLVHCGDEVYSVLMRMFATLVLEAL